MMQASVISSARQTASNSVVADSEASTLVRVITTVSDLESVRNVWDALRTATDVPAISSDPDRFMATINATAQSTVPHVVVIGPAENPTAMLVGRSLRHRSRCRIGYVHIPTPKLRCLMIAHGGVMTNGDHESIRQIVQYFDTQEVIDKFDLVLVNKLSQGHPAMPVITALPRAIRREVRTHWVTDLVPGSFEKSMSWHNRKHRSQLRRRDKKLCEYFDGVLELKCYEHIEHIDAVLDAVAAIWPKTYKAGLNLERPDSVTSRATYAKAATQGKMLCYVLYGRGSPIAYQLGVRTGNWYHAESTAYLPEYRSLAPGKCLLIRVFQDLCERGVEIFDWGFGDAEDKRIYGTRSWDEANINIYGRSIAATYTRYVDVFCEWAKRFVARHLSRYARSKIKTRWRKRLERKSNIETTLE